MKKRIATFLILIFILCTTNTFANEPVPVSKAVAQSIAELLRSEIDYPDFARFDEFECNVLVRININDDGSFSVDCVNCKDIRLKMYVKDKIERINSKEYAKFNGQTVSLKVVFKLIS